MAAADASEPGKPDTTPAALLAATLPVTATASNAMTEVFVAVAE
jgi:hypothetical protein